MPPENQEIVAHNLREGHGAAYQERNKSAMRIHLGYESITDDSHVDSPHMRQRISGIINKEFPHTKIVHLSSHTEECMRLCKDRRPNIAILSATLPENDGVTLTNVIRTLVGTGVLVMILQKEGKPNLGEALSGILHTTVTLTEVNAIKETLARLLTNEEPA